MELVYYLLSKAASVKWANAAFGREEATRTPDPHVPNVVRYQLRYFSFFSLRRKNLGIAWDFVIFWVVKQGTPPSFISENNLIPSQILDLDEHFTNSRSRQRT